MRRKPPRLLTPRGSIRLGGQRWPASAIGATEFNRTQARRAPWLKEVADVWQRWQQGDEPGMMVTTSGTTGAPRLVEHSRKAVLSSVNDTLSHFELGEGTQAVLALPASFVAGQAMLIRALVGGWDLTLTPPSSEPTWQGQFDFVALTPHQAQGWIDRGQGSAGILLLGGGPVALPLLRALLANPRVGEIWEGYGSSETLTHVALRHLREEADLNAPFLSLPSVSMKLNEAGCMVVHDPSREVHAHATQDCFEAHPAGGWLWLGRNDDVINTGGVLVHPSTIEQAFGAICEPWVTDWVAYGRPDDTLGQALVLRVQGALPQSVHAADVASSWRSQLKDLVGPAKAPRHVEWGKIPRNKHGKALRRDLS